MVMSVLLTMSAVKWTLLFLYIFMSCLYAYDRFWNNGSVQEALFSLILCLLLPAAGFVIVWMMDYYEGRRKKKDFSEIFQGSSFFHDELQILRPVNREKEMNIVPMEETLIINDYEFRRKAVMNTLTEDNTLDYLEVLKEALENEDAETSHYASSVIMRLQAQAQNGMVERAKNFERNPGDDGTTAQYEKELCRLLNSGLFEKENMRRYFLQYKKLSEQIFLQEKPEEIYFRHRVRICFLEKDYTTAETVLERYLKLYPRSEDAVLCKILQCIYSRNRRELEHFLDELPGRSVILTQKTLEYIRFFNHAPGTEAQERSRH